MYPLGFSCCLPSKKEKQFGIKFRRQDMFSLRYPHSNVPEVVRYRALRVERNWIWAPESED